MQQSTTTIRTVSVVVLCMVLYCTTAWGAVIKNPGFPKPGYPLEKMDPIDACLFICPDCFEVSAPVYSYVKFFLVSEKNVLEISYLGCLPNWVVIRQLKDI